MYEIIYNRIDKGKSKCYYKTVIIIIINYKHEKI